MGRVLRCAGRMLDLTQPQVMGILNITPDSFSDGGRYWQGNAVRLDRVLRRAERMQQQGAAILDIGGESTRPGAAAVSEQQEMDRVLPVLRALAARFEMILSVDTSTPAVMREAAAVGAGLINDVRALRRPGALSAAAASDLAVCLMHMQGEPGTMQQQPQYENISCEVREFLLDRVSACLEAGIARDRVLIDPGFGFGKTLEHNLSLLRGLRALGALGYPVLIGVSRKSMIGRIVGKEEPRGRLAGGLALVALAAEQGVAVVRTHDVGATQAVLRVVAAVTQGRGG